MRLFGWGSRPQARPALTRAFGMGGAGDDWPQGYEAQVRAAYLGNAVAQRAVRIVAEGAGSVPVDATPAEHPAAALLRGAANGQPLIETAAAQLLLHGDAFVQIILDADGMPAELFALRPERVTVEQDARGWPVAYLYRAGGSVARIAAEGAEGAEARPGLVHVRTMHPLDDHYGLGCLGAAAGPVAIHNAATRWNKALLDNAARPSGALVYDPGEPGAALSAVTVTPVEQGVTLTGRALSVRALTDARLRDFAGLVR